MKILSCYFRGALAWAMLVDADALTPAAHDEFTYVVH